MIFEPNVMGRDGFYWFQGVVEDRQDPKKLGRIRVRVFGLHTDDKNLIPTEELPWAYVMMPVTSAAMTGLGESPLGPVPGTHVVGFFRDGDSCQEPIVIGTIAGIPEEATQKPKGFYDPRDSDTLVEKLADAPRKIKTRDYHKDGSGVVLTPEDAAKNYPRVINPLDNVIGEPDTNRLARAEIIGDTIVQLKKDTRDKAVPISFGGTWDEPAPAYAAKYPYNHVTESESGHIEENDDTPDHERTHRWNRTGTFEEIGPDGQRIFKVVAHDFEILMKDHEIHIMGKKQETVQHDYDLYVQGNFNIQVDGNVNLLVKGSVYEHVKGSVNSTVDGSLVVKTGGDYTHKVGGKVAFEVGGKFSIKAQEVDIVTTGDINMDAANIWLNSGHAHADDAPDPTKPKVV